jgi:glutamate racemase
MSYDANNAISQTKTDGTLTRRSMNTQFAIRNSQFAIPVGVFDSGVGGLSVVREIMALLPAQPIIYLADQAHAPYGQRPLTEIRALSEGIARFLLAEGAGVIVIACNTASAAALHGLREQFLTVPFVGMEPAVKPAVEHTRTGQVGVIATAATFQGELFASLLDRYAGRVTIHTQICPELVPLVEAGELSSPRTRDTVTQYLTPLLAAEIDQLVLGCTHYPFLRPLIEEVAGAGVVVIDPAPAVARQAGRVLAQHGWLVTDDTLSAYESDIERQKDLKSAHRFYTTGGPNRFQAALRDLLGVRAEVRQAIWQPGYTLLPSR